MSTSSVALKDSIVTKVLKLVFSLYIVIAMAVTLTHMVAEYYNTQDSILHDLQVLQETFQNSLAESIWAVDTVQIQNILSGMLKNSIVVGVKIEPTEEAAGFIMGLGIVLNVEGQLRSINLAGQQQPVAETGLPFGLLPYAFSLKYRPTLLEQKDMSTGTLKSVVERERTIGTVTLYSSTKVVLQKVQYGFAFILINSLIKTLALWGIFLVVGRIMLSRPLSILTGFAEVVNLDNLGQTKVDIHTTERHELKLLEEAFNTMLDKLYRSTQELQTAQELLQQGSVALKKALKKTQRAEEELRYIHDFVTVANSTLELRQILHTLMTEIVQWQYLFEGVCLHLLDEQQQVLRLTEIVFEAGNPPPDTLHTLYPLPLPLIEEGGCFAQVFRSQQLLYLDQITTEIMKTPLEQQYYAVLPFRCMLVVPLVAQQQSFGLLTFFQRSISLRFSAQHLTEIQSFIDHITPSLNNARLYTEIQKEQQAIQTQNATLSQLTQQLSQYLSPQVMDSLLSRSAEGYPEAHRKKLTVLFSSIPHFAEITENLEAEVLTQLWNSYLRAMSHIALRYQGTLEMVGERLMVFFGDPESQGEKEDALACVRMALEMRKHLQTLQPHWEKAGVLEPLRLRMGINTGYCTVGNFGSASYRLNYTVVGGQVNLAHYLALEAQADELLISYATYVLVQEKILCEPCGERIFPGIPQPVPTYRVLGLKDRLQSQAFHKEGQGYAFAFDFLRISEVEKSRLALSVERALQQLRPPS